MAVSWNPLFGGHCMGPTARDPMYGSAFPCVCLSRHKSRRMVLHAEGSRTKFLYHSTRENTAAVLKLRFCRFMSSWKSRRPACRRAITAPSPRRHCAITVPGVQSSPSDAYSHSATGVNWDGSRTVFGPNGAAVTLPTSTAPFSTASVGKRRPPGVVCGR